MKKVFVLFLLVMAVTKASGQYLTADEMIVKTKCRTFDCFNDFIAAKGFSYYTTQKDNSSITYAYTSDVYIRNKTDPEILNKNSALIVINNNPDITNIGFRTNNKEYYLKLLDEFKTRGFTSKSTRQKNDGKGVETTYKSKNYPGHTLTVLIEKLDKGEKEWTSYDFEVSY